MIEVNKSDLISELEKIALFLNDYKLCEDTSPIYSAMTECLEKSTDATWSYSISNLLFRIAPTSHTIPHDADDITVSLSLSIEGIFNNNNKEIKNPLQSLEFNIEISGAFLEANDVLKLKAAWHLDKHIPKKAGELTKYIHPEYHLTHGGRKIWDLTGYNYGQSIILPTPRLCHPPMDGILGIDFILQNYFKKEAHMDLTMSLDYLRLIGGAQNRLWRPYYLAIANSFPPTNDIVIQSCISAKGLVPNIA